MSLTSPQRWQLVHDVCEIHLNHLVSLQLIATLLGLGEEE